MADHIILVENPTDWKTHFPKLPVVAAKDYLARPEYSSAGRSLRVLNLCRSYRYSERRLLLLAAGRSPPSPGHPQCAHA
jgi:hypothetical protein